MWNLFLDRTGLITIHGSVLGFEHQMRQGLFRLDKPEGCVVKCKGHELQSEKDLGLSLHSSTS